MISTICIKINKLEIKLNKTLNIQEHNKSHKPNITE